MCIRDRFCRMPMHKRACPFLAGSGTGSPMLDSIRRRLFLRSLAVMACAGCAGGPAPKVPAAAPTPPSSWPSKTHYREVTVRQHRIFYREAGEGTRPTILLLHGYPASSHSYRELIPLLSGRYHVVCLLYTSDAADERSSVDLGG